MGCVQVQTFVELEVTSTLLAPLGTTITLLKSLLIRFRRVRTCSSRSMACEEMRGNLNCAFSSVASTDAAHVLLQRGAKDPIAAHPNAVSLDAEVAWVVVGARGAVEDVFGGGVVGLLDTVEAGQLALVLWVPVQRQK